MKKSDKEHKIMNFCIIFVSKKSQVWVETAIYTLMGLTLIAVVMGIALPQIENMKDRETIKQSIVALNLLNQKISEVLLSSSNLRIYNLLISKGEFEIDCVNEMIYYRLKNTRLQFSELNEKIKEGDITILTEKYGSRYNIILSLNLSSNTNLTLNNQDNSKILRPGPSPYSVKIYNTGAIDSFERYNIDVNI
jgi:type II secretory pathway pseudopilin PulG